MGKNFANASRRGSEVSPWKLKASPPGDRSSLRGESGHLGTSLAYIFFPPLGRLQGMPVTDRIRGRRGQERRARWLFKHPLCARCLAKGRITAAEEVDHVIPLRHGGADRESNLESICRGHHREKTARERGDRPVLEVGVDGWPKT